MYEILIVEDDAAIRAGLTEKLDREGFRVRCAVDGEDALVALRDRSSDLVILDLMLPKLDGLSVLRHLRKTEADLPVLILSARGEEQQKVEGLRAGADDYLAKPFGLEELMARVHALLRRAYGAVEVVAFGEVTVDPATRRVARDGEEVPLSRKELDLLLYLVRHRGHVLDRDQILDSVWGGRNLSEGRAVDYHILNLRRKLEVDPAVPRHIVTRHGLGYVLEL